MMIVLRVREVGGSYPQVYHSPSGDRRLLSGRTIQAAERAHAGRLRLRLWRCRSHRYLLSHLLAGRLDGVL